METLLREIWEETGLSFWSQYALEIWRERATANHFRVAYLVDYEVCSGQLRQTGLRDGYEFLSPPEWAPARTVGGSLYPSHQGAYLEALKYFDL